MLTFEVSGLKGRLLSRDACFQGAPTFELLFSAPANFKSMVEYLWRTYDLASFCAITLRKWGGGGTRALKVALTFERQLILRLGRA